MTLTTDENTVLNAIPVPGLATISGQALSILGVKGKTSHIGWQNDRTLTLPLSGLIVVQVQKCKPVIVSALSAASLPKMLKGFMSKPGGWWSVGNNQRVELIPACDALAANDFNNLFYYLLMWSFGNAPGDSFSDAYNASKEFLSLPGGVYDIMISQGDKNTPVLIDAMIANVANVPAAGKITAGTSSTALAGTSSTASDNTGIFVIGALVVIVIGYLLFINGDF